MTRSRAFLLPCAAGAAGLYAARRAGDGTPEYYALTFAVAAVYAAAWAAWGDRSAFSGRGAAGQLAGGVGAGLALAVVFFAGALVASRIPALAEPVSVLLSTTQRGGLAPTLAVLVLNGIGEELVYRDVVPRQLARGGFVRAGLPAAAASVGIYVLMTVAMGVPLLLIGAAALGALCQWLAWRTGRLWAPVGAHLAWSTSMLLVLPLFF